MSAPVSSAPPAAPASGTAPAAPAATGGKRSAWMTHVKKTMRANKGMKLASVLKLAKKSYKKTMRGGSKGGVASTASPLSGGRRRRSSKKGSRKH